MGNENTEISCFTYQRIENGTHPYAGAGWGAVSRLGAATLAPAVGYARGVEVTVATAAWVTSISLAYEVRGKSNGP